MIDTKFNTIEKIIQELDKSIIGQDYVKKIVATAAYNSFISSNNKLKFNVILKGLPGIGKTYIITTLAKILKIPIVIFDCTMLTPKGYIGMSIEDVFISFIKKDAIHKEDLENSIVLFENIEKLKLKDRIKINHLPIEERDFYCNLNYKKEQILDSLTNIIKGTPLKLNIKSSFLKNFTVINTSNMLFFGIETAIKAEEYNINNNCFNGFVVCNMQSFNKNEMIYILDMYIKKVKSSYNIKFDSLNFTKEALESILNNIKNFSNEEIRGSIFFTKIIIDYIKNDKNFKNTESILIDDEYINNNFFKVLK